MTITILSYLVVILLLSILMLMWFVAHGMQRLEDDMLDLINDLAEELGDCEAKLMLVSARVDTMVREARDGNVDDWK